jgi:VirE N-terminal domain/AAA domain
MTMSLSAEELAASFAARRNAIGRVVISMVRSATDTKTRDIRVDQVLTAIRTGGEKLKGQITQIRNRFEAELAITGGDRKAAKLALDVLKKQLPAVLPSGQFSKRGNDALVMHSGLLCADLDSLGQRRPEIREQLKQSPHVFCYFLSPTGDGLKVWVRVPAEATKHAASFRAVGKQILELTGIQIDQSCKDAARLCFMSYDPQLYVNVNAQEIKPLPESKKPKLRRHSADRDTKPYKAQIREMLGVIPKRPDYPDWVKVVAAVGDALDDPDAIEVLNEWSPEERKGEYADKLRHRLKDVRVGTLIHLARERGWTPKKDIDEKRPDLWKGAEKPARTRHYALSDLAAIAAKPVDWIEEPYLARGEMHFLQGQGGSYKGTLALTWAAEFSQRGEHVLLVLAEDDLAKKVKPLLMAGKADMAFIHPVTMKCGETEDSVVLPDDLDQLEQAMADTQAALVNIDPLLSHVSGSLDSYRDHDMKRVLTRIGHLAQRMNAVIVCVHHTKKDTSGGMKLAGQGSTAFYTTARLVLAMAKLSEHEVVLEVVKSNLGPEAARQLLRAELIEVSPGIIVPKLKRAGESPVGVAEALNCQRIEKETKTLSAAKLMLDILEEEGEQKQVELFDRVARETGLTPGSIRRHAYFGILIEEDLVCKRKDGFKGGWFVSRSDRERPLSLLPNRGPESMSAFGRIVTEECHTTEICHSSAFYEGISTHKLCHSSGVDMRRVTSDPACHSSEAVTPREEIEKSPVEQPNLSPSSHPPPSEKAPSKNTPSGEPGKEPVSGELEVNPGGILEL